jgi:hypothetical protein
MSTICDNCDAVVELQQRVEDLESRLQKLSNAFNEVTVLACASSDIGLGLVVKRWQRKVRLVLWSDGKEHTCHSSKNRV